MNKLFLLAMLVSLGAFANDDYTQMLDTAAKIEKDRATAITAFYVAQQEKNEKLSEVIKSCSLLKNEVAQMVCSLAATGNLGGSMTSQPAPMASLSLPMPVAEAAWYDKLLDRTLQVVDRVIPVWGIRENRRATVDVARIQAGVQIAGYEATTAQFDIMGKSNTSIAVASLNRPILPTTQYTFGDVPGNINFGGSQEVNSNSKNVSNITTTNKNCPGGQAGSSSGSATIPGTGGSSPGGNC